MPETTGSARREAPDRTEIPASTPSELSRLRSEAAFHQRLRDLTVAFSRGVSSSLNLGTALHTLASDANNLFGAYRTSVWLHQRRERELLLAASSDGDRATAAARVPTADADLPPARGLRLERPVVIESAGKVLLLAPLRGWRRALGAIIVQGPFTDELDELQMLELAHELGRQLSATVENIQLLDEVLRQRRLLEDTFNSILDLVIVTDGDLRVVQMNDAFVDRMGLSRAELLEMRLENVLGDEMARWSAAGYSLGGGAEWPQGERSQRFQDEKLGGTFSVTMTPLINQEGEPAGRVLVARDISHQMRLETEREALRLRLAQSEKLAALGQFVAGIAHEMNNPLQGVLGHLELMMTTSEAARPLKKELRRIFQEADRAAKIVKNLLAFTGSRRLVRRRLKLGRILSRVVASRAAALGNAGIEVIKDIPADLPPVSGDAMLLHQAFLNVLINAEHAVLARESGRRIEIRSWADPAGSMLTTTVQDSGGGIPAEVLPRIFDPFFTTKDVGKGTGLGLAITYGIIQDHGGAIYAVNGVDGGVILTIELPAAVV
jgi:PAS domain S-box-containing protein